MIDDPAVLVSRPGTMHGSTKTFATGRICKWCDTILSRYNPTKWCRAHEHLARRVGNLYGGLMPHGSVLRDVESPASEHPMFRCDGCEHAYPIEYQWLTAHLRFCAWCRPVGAVRSDALELTS